MATVSPIELQKHLKGLSYPTNKSELVSTAKGNGAQGDLLEALDALPDKDFDSVTDVTHELKEADQTN